MPHAVERARRPALLLSWVVPCAALLALAATGTRTPAQHAVSPASGKAPPGDQALVRDAAPPGSAADVVGPPTAETALAPAPRNLKARMLADSRLPGPPGPLAPSVRDALNEMMIESRLLSLADATAPYSLAETRDVGRRALLGAVPAHLPADGFLSSRFGPRRSPFTGRVRHHNGIDIGIDHGAAVYATADGVVTYAGWRKFLGNIVVIDHGFGIVTKYAHNSALLVETGDAVRRGAHIAKAGSTGRSTGPHLHYEVWVNGRAVDPLRFMFDVPQRSEREVDAHLAMLKQRPLGGDGESDERAMGGEVSWSDAPEIGAASRWAAIRPDPREQLGVNLAILSVFLLLSGVIVAMARPRPYAD